MSSRGTLVTTCCFLLSITLAPSGCDCSGSVMHAACTSSRDCPTGETCVDRVCGHHSTVDGGGSADACTPCGSACCGADELCVGGHACAADRGPCTSSDTCENDSYCDATLGRCVGYGPTHDHDDSCHGTLHAGAIQTRVQCEWTDPPAGDAYAGWVNATSLPIVADFGITPHGPDDPVHPSIAVATEATGASSSGASVIRVLDGVTCAQQATIDTPKTYGGVAIAAGDLDGDNRPEVVAPTLGGGVAAWTWDATMHQFRLLWESTDTSSGGLSSSVTLADLDDDGHPEVIVGALVYSGADGSLRSAAAGVGDRHCGSYVPPSSVADVDLDMEPELVLGSSVWRWDTATSALVRESYSTGPGVTGAAAVADFGDFPGHAGDAPGRPEIAVIVGGAGSIETIGGEVVFGPIPFGGIGEGGNPTIADFDGDGQAEFATAGYSNYTVFDPDCLAGATTRAGTCATGRTDGILWTATIQENSCAIMGSTVFDFEGDGAAEVVYADECFARIFDGHTGRVLWSRRRSSATWIEGPTVADVDGDFHAEMVLTATDIDYLPSCPAVDAQDPGVGCTTTADCPSATTCDSGLCRCTADADCGDAELTCTTPLSGSAGTGNVCRASYGHAHGVRVYGDILDRWAGSRAIWNQHAYSVTNVNEDGTIPRSSLMANNWSTPGLNNFRQNVQGMVPPAAASDLTVRGVSYSHDCDNVHPMLTLTAEVCDRGPLGVPAGVDVVFYDADPATGGHEVCRTATTHALLVAECEDVSCVWSMPPLSTPLDVHIAVDTAAAVPECLEGNDFGTLAAHCPPPLM